MLRLFIEARFAAFRPFITGSFRPTAPFMTPSAAYGLLLNLAGEEMRERNDDMEMTRIKSSGLPQIKVALGVPACNKPYDELFPKVQNLYQQLHNYPVGQTNKKHAINTKGNKYNITPVRRSFLSGLRVIACFDGYSDNLEKQIIGGLRGEGKRTYGLPFVGDNNFLPDRIEVLDEPWPTFWFTRVKGSNQQRSEYVGRLTITIDRRISANTRSDLFYPIKEPDNDPPDDAWVDVNYSA